VVVPLFGFSSAQLQISLFGVALFLMGIVFGGVAWWLISWGGGADDRLGIDFAWYY
jgi:hypothetical protein